jgi:hypothetical protein
MNIPKELLSALKERGITSFELRFQGGSDEGYLEVSLTPEDRALETQVEDWADSAFCYSGAGDGTDYGDNYVYDLVNMTIQHTEWHHEPTYDEHSPEPFEAED